MDRTDHLTLAHTLLGEIREYGSTLYVGMACKNMAAYTFQFQLMS